MAGMAKRPEGAPPNAWTVVAGLAGLVIAFGVTDGVSLELVLGAIVALSLALELLRKRGR